MGENFSMQVEVYQNAYCNSFEFFPTSQFSLGLDYISKVSTGALYTEEGNKIDISVRKGGMVGDKVLDASPSFYKDNTAGKIKGRSVYLGPFMAHYGHFITEGLSRFWLLEHSNFDNVIFSPFIFGPKLDKFHDEIFHLFGIKNIHIVSQPTCFEEIWVPEQLWFINSKPKYGLKRVYDFIKEHYSNSNIIDKKRNLKIYDFLTKHNSNNNQHKNVSVGRYFLSDKNQNSRIKNKSDVEQTFKEKGFDIIFPEELSFYEQMSYYLSAKVLICFSGTLAHNALFCNENITKIIEIGDVRSKSKPIPMQEFIYDMLDIQYKYINYVGDEEGNLSLSYLQNFKLEGEQ